MEEIFCIGPLSAGVVQAGTFCLLKEVSSGQTTAEGQGPPPELQDPSCQTSTDRGACIPKIAAIFLIASGRKP